MTNGSFSPVEWILSDVSTPSQGEPGNNSSEEIFRFLLGRMLHKDNFLSEV